MASTSPTTTTLKPEPADVPMYLAVLADPLKFRILLTLRIRPRSVQELIHLLSPESGRIPDSTVSHALAVLKEFHLVQYQQNWRQRIYRLNEDVIDQVFAAAQAVFHVDHSE